MFCLHHGPSLSDLLDKTERDKFDGLLDRFWTRYCKDWDVLLNGNPATDVFGGLKLAAGGELGMGVGEEEWGSGEREVLEDLMRQTEGLVDVVVSRFGEPAGYDPEELPWLGSGSCPQPHDGVMFSGRGALSRSSLRDVSIWAELIYARGEGAYGVSDSPQRLRRRRPRSAAQPTIDSQRKEAEQLETDRNVDATKSDNGPVIPPPIVRGAEQKLPAAAVLGGKQGSSPSTVEFSKPDDSSAFSGFGSSETWLKYLTLGLSTVKPKADPEVASSTPGVKSAESASNSPTKPTRDAIADLVAIQQEKEARGYFLIGYRGNLDSTAHSDSDGELPEEDDGERTILRTVHVDRFSQAISEDGYTYGLGCTPLEPQRLRVLVYVRRPFIYTLLFEQNTDGPQIAAFYRTLHRHLQPLHKPLLTSTSVDQVSRRIADAHMAPDNASTRSSSMHSPAKPTPVFDLVYDPLTLTVHTSLPNIPEPGTTAAEGLAGTTSTGRTGPPAWTRIEALNVHLQILQTLDSTSRHTYDLERTSKTSRGWWITWLRVPPSSVTDEEQQQGISEPHVASRPADCRVAFLVRKANGSNSSTAISSAGSRLVSGAGSIMAGFGARGEDAESTKGHPLPPVGGPGWGTGVLSGGIGVDARRYVENLLSLNR